MGRAGITVSGQTTPAAGCTRSIPAPAHGNGERGERGRVFLRQGGVRGTEEARGKCLCARGSRASRSRRWPAAGSGCLRSVPGEWLSEDPAAWRFSIAGIVGFIDPPKESAAEAVRIAQRAGIRVIMITGDHPLTAREVARSVHIWKEGDRLLTGPDIEGMNDDELAAALKQATVLARILPEHKYRVVKTLQEHGEIVTVTGDGVNDVPALRAADLGIAMGSGSEAAKSAAKMVIVDNNLSVIVDAIRNARVIVDNIRKVIYYLVSTSISEIVLISSTVFFGLPLPLLPIQILWINLVTDGVQDKTFPFIREEGNVMARSPKDPAQQFFDSRQMRRILAFGLVHGRDRGSPVLVPARDISVRSCRHNHVHRLCLLPVVQRAAGPAGTRTVPARHQKKPHDQPVHFLWYRCRHHPPAHCALCSPGIFGVVPPAPGHWGYVALLSLAAFSIVEAIKWLENRESHPAP